MTALLLTVEEAAKLLAISTRSVQRLVARGEIKTCRIGRSVRIARTALDDLIQTLHIAQSYNLHESTDATGHATCGNVIKMDCTSGRGHPSGGPRHQTRTDAGKALDDLLRSRSSKTPRG